jgi:hypothetical protein
MNRSLMVLLCGSVAACGAGDGGEPADPAAARAEIDAIVPSLTDDTSDSLDAAGAMGGVEALRASMTSMNASFELPFDLPLAEDVARKLAQESDERPGAALARWLRERVFVDAAYEGDGVFRISGARVCPVEDGATAPDPDCVQAIDDAELRVRATRPDGGGLDLVILVGPERSAPIELGLRAGAIDVAVDLAEAKEALLHLAAVTGEELELPSVMRGRVGVSLERRGARHVALAAGVRQAIEIAGEMEGGPFSLSVQAREPVLAVELDLPRGAFSVDVDVGRVALAAPWRVLSPDSAATGQGSFELAGVTAAATLGDTLRIDDVSLGGSPLAVKLGAHTILSVALAALDVEVVPTAAAPRILLSPGLEVVVTLGTRPLADAGDEVAAWTHDEVVTLRAGQEVVPYAGGVEAVRGAISISAAKAGASVTAAEGQCLAGSPLTAGEHPLVGLFAAVPCP